MNATPKDLRKLSSPADSSTSSCAPGPEGDGAECGRYYTAALLRRRPDGVSKTAAGSSGTDAQAQMGYDTRALLGQSSHRAAAPAPRVGISRAVSPPGAGRCWRTWTPLAMLALGTRLGLTAGARARNLRCSGTSLPARLHRPLHHTSLRSSRRARPRLGSVDVRVQLARAGAGQRSARPHLCRAGRHRPVRGLLQHVLRRGLRALRRAGVLRRSHGRDVAGHSAVHRCVPSCPRRMPWRHALATRRAVAGAAPVARCSSADARVACRSLRLCRHGCIDLHSLRRWLWPEPVPALRRAEPGVRRRPAGANRGRTRGAGCSGGGTRQADETVGRSTLRSWRGVDGLGSAVAGGFRRRAAAAAAAAAAVAQAVRCME
jgi:hypothetical protein